MNHNESTPQVQKTDEEWRTTLTPDQYRVLREAGTEPAFTGELLENKESGVYICGACEAVLFASDGKYESHCGWPSFTHPKEQENVRLLPDHSYGMERTEVRCKRCDSHLGHVFDDGPGPDGNRFCINSLSLRFRKD